MGIFNWLKQKKPLAPDKKEESKKNIEFHIKIDLENLDSNPDARIWSPNKNYKACVSYIEQDFKKKLFKQNIEIIGNDKKFIYEIDSHSPITEQKLTDNGTFVFVENNINQSCNFILHILKAGNVINITREGYCSSFAISEDSEICGLVDSGIKTPKRVLIYGTKSGDLMYSWDLQDKNLNKIEIIKKDTFYCVSLSDLELGTFEFSLSGNFDNEKAYIDAELEKGNIYTVISRVDKILKMHRKSDGDTVLRELLPYIEHAHYPQFSNETHCRKEALITKARILEKMGDYVAALSNYEEAAKIQSTNPIKKKITSLKKRIETLAAKAISNEKNSDRN